MTFVCRGVCVASQPYGPDSQMYNIAPIKAKDYFPRPAAVVSYCQRETPSIYEFFRYQSLNFPSFLRPT